ncbi:XRE family transcriptional regulator [Bosea thiooxidans]
MDDDVHNDEGVEPNRLPELLGSVKNLAAFARETGISRRMLDRYKALRGEPSLSNAARIARALSLPIDALVQDIFVSGRQEGGAESDEKDHVSSIPLLDVIASAGPGIENPFPLAIDHLPFPKRWLDELGLPERYARFLGARGDSMEPTILDGAICLADIRFQVPRVDGVYALIDGNDVRIKRIARGWEGKIVLISDNERYESETLAAPDAEALRVAGKIVWSGGKI